MPATRSLTQDPTMQQTLAAAIRANTDPAIVAAVAARNDDVIRDWYNLETSTDAWRSDIDGQALFEATPITVFDGISAGKREAWRLMIDQAQISPLDFGRPNLRAAVRDIWTTPNGDAILTACRRKATRAELIFGGKVEASGAISATDLNVEIVLTSYDVSVSLNNFPA